MASEDDNDFMFDSESFDSAQGSDCDQVEHLVDQSINSNVSSGDSEFKSISVKEVAKKLEQSALTVSEILGLPILECKILLAMFRWDKDVLIDKVTKGINYSMENKFKRSRVAITCGICYNDERITFTAEECGHTFCADCYRHYFEDKIRQSEILVKCPAECNVIVGCNNLELLLNEQSMRLYHTQILNKYIDDHSYYKWCTFPECDHVVECHFTSSGNARNPVVECSYGHRFCFGCSNGDHLPATCSIAKKWTSKCQEDGKTALWIHTNSKECPKCHVVIEKNGGCNHMTCKKCNNQFCWVCLGAWSRHSDNYNCNRFNEEESITARNAQDKSRAESQRYVHYFERYSNHNLSANLEKLQHEKAEMSMNEIQQNTNFTWIQVQCMAKAVDVLAKARQTLMWTYGVAYYLDSKKNSTHIFEDNQKDLEMAVENLSGLLEVDVNLENAQSLRLQILDKTEYVQRRMQVMLADDLRRETI